jgi:hypothetical protein
MLAEINFQLTKEQKATLDSANAEFHKVSYEGDSFGDASATFDALMLAWAFIGDLNSDWIY